MIPGHMVILLATAIFFFFLIAVSWSKNAFWGRMGFLVAEPRVTTGEGNRCTARLEVWYPPRYNTSMVHTDTVVALNNLAAASCFWLTNQLKTSPERNEVLKIVSVFLL